MLKKIQGFRGTKEAHHFAAQIEQRVAGADLFPEYSAEQSPELKFSTPKGKTPGLN